jgi:hypothetical protein
MDDPPTFLHDCVRDSSGCRGIVGSKSRLRSRRTGRDAVPTPLFLVTINRGMDDPPAFLHDCVRDSSGCRGIVGSKSRKRHRPPERPVPKPLIL